MTLDDRARQARVPKCPSPTCGEWASTVKDGRPSSRGYRRVRICSACKSRFVTIEQVTMSARVLPKKSTNHYI